MSIDVMNLVWRSTLEGSSKRFVLLALADRADDDGYCWPGVQNIADKTGLSVRTVDRVRKELEADRLLLQQERWTAQGGRDTNGYWINLQALLAMQRPRESKRGPHPMAVPEAPQGDPVTTTGGSRHHDPTPPVTMTGNTSVETAGSPQEENQDQKNSASAASRQAATAQQQPKRPLFDPPFVKGQDCRREWIESTIGGFGAGEDAKVDSLLQRNWHPYRIVNTLNAQRWGSTDKSPYRKGYTEKLDRIGELIGGYQGTERQDAMDLLICRYSEDEIVWQLTKIYRVYLSEAA